MKEIPFLKVMGTKGGLRVHDARHTVIKASTLYVDETPRQRHPRTQAGCPGRRLSAFGETVLEQRLPALILPDAPRASAGSRPYSAEEQTSVLFRFQNSQPAPWLRMFRQRQQNPQPTPFQNSGSMLLWAGLVLNTSHTGQGVRGLPRRRRLQACPVGVSNSGGGLGARWRHPPSGTSGKGEPYVALPRC